LVKNKAINVKFPAKIRRIDNYEHRCRRALRGFPQGTQMNTDCRCEYLIEQMYRTFHDHSI